jgi:hypothetical protein
MLVSTALPPETADTEDAGVVAIVLVGGGCMVSCRGDSFG